MLPEPNARPMPAGQTVEEVTQEQIRGTVSNPIYAGLGPYPAVVSDETWINAAIKQIDEVGITQFLVNMLYCLRATFGTTNLATMRGNDVQQRRQSKAE